MTRGSPTFLALAVLAVCPAPARPADPAPYAWPTCRTAARLAAGDPGLGLVDAVVASATEDQGFQTARLKVIRVYSGSKNLAGAIFTDQAIAQGSDFGIYTRPKYAIGEAVVCTLAAREKGGWMVIARERGDKAALDAFRKAAEQVEALTRMAAPARQVAVRRLCADRDPRIAAFAVHVVGDELSDESERRRVGDFLAGLPNDPAVGVRATLAADGVLLDGPGWADSKRREAFFRRWVGAPTAAEARAVLAHLSLHSGEGVGADRTARLMGDTLHAAGERPKELRQYAVERIAMLATPDPACWAAVVEQLARVVKGDPDAGVRLDAAIYLANLSRFTPAPPGVPRPKYTAGQRAVLQELLKAEPDPSVGDALRKALKDG